MGDRSNLMLLMGAGASVDAGVPAAYAMPPKLLERIDDDAHLRNAVEFVLETLRIDRLRREIHARVTHSWSSVSREVDVEALLRALDLLAQRSDLEVSPFIREWEPAVSQLDVASRWGSRLTNDMWEALVDDLKEALGGSVSITPHGGRETLRASVEYRRHGSGFARGHRFKEAFQAAISGDAAGGDGSTFRECRAALERALRGVARVQEVGRTAYMSQIMKKCRRFGRTTIASLNYDNVVEVAGQEAGLCVDVPIGAADFRDDGDDIILLKLHGSADWIIGDRGVVTRDTEASEQNRRSSALIFGQVNKLTSGPPFFDLFLSYRDALYRSKKLLTVGYSWRDKHVNTVVESWLRSNAHASLVIVDPVPRSEFNRPLLERFSRQIQLVPHTAAGLASDFDTVLTSG